MTFLSGVHCLLPVGYVNCVRTTLKATATPAATLSLTLTLTLAINSSQTLQASRNGTYGEVVATACMVLGFNHGFCCVRVSIMDSAALGLASWILPC